MQKNAKLKNWTLILVLFIFFACPFFIAQWVFYHKGSTIPTHFGTVNHGKLIQPLITLKQVADNTKNITHLKQHWTILYVASNGQDTQKINQALDKIYRIRLALGKEYSQVGELFGHLPHNSLSSNPLKIKSITLSSEGQKKLLEQLNLAQGIFLVDSSGNIFMAYPENINSDDIYKDLKRLLSNQ